MFKGRIILLLISVIFYPSLRAINFQQDTLKIAPPNATNSQININRQKIHSISDSLGTTKKYSQHHIDSLFKISEKRETQILKNKYEVAKEIVVMPTDTISSKYNQYNYPFERPTKVNTSINQNILENINFKNYSHFKTDSKNFLTRRIAHSQDSLVNNMVTKNLVPQKNYIEGKLRYKSEMNWLVIVLLSALFIFSWVKVLYQKYILQIVGSVIDYQISSRLFRERNIFFRNVSIGLNFIFALNLGLLIYYILDYYTIGQIVDGKFSSLVIYSSAIILLYSIKSVTCKLIGYIFLVQEEFAEYMHNVIIFNKNIGLFLFPIVIVYPYIHEKLQPIILYIGVGLLIIMVLMRAYRGFQIIIRKGVPIFYLILYLCAIEILPALLLLKLSSTLI